MPISPASPPTACFLENRLLWSQGFPWSLSEKCTHAPLLMHLFLPASRSCGPPVLLFAEALPVPSLATLSIFFSFLLWQLRPWDEISDHLLWILPTSLFALLDCGSLEDGLCPGCFCIPRPNLVPYAVLVLNTYWMKCVNLKLKEKKRVRRKCRASGQVSKMFFLHYKLGCGLWSTQDRCFFFL